MDCSRCAAAVDAADPAALRWTFDRDGVDRDGFDRDGAETRWLCPACTRACARDIEARLPEEWWAEQRWPEQW